VPYIVISLRKYIPRFLTNCNGVLTNSSLGLRCVWLGSQIYYNHPSATVFYGLKFFDYSYNVEQNAKMLLLTLERLSCQIAAGLLMWGALSDERTGLSFTLLLASPAHSVSGPSPVGLMTILYRLRFETPPTWRTRSPYFCPTGDLVIPPGTGFPFRRPPTTRRATAEVFEPTSTEGLNQSVPHRKHTASP
jgi:hypothetical protein